MKSESNHFACLLAPRLWLVLSLLCCLLGIGNNAFAFDPDEPCLPDLPPDLIEPPRDDLPDLPSIPEDSPEELRAKPALPKDVDPSVKITIKNQELTADDFKAIAAFPNLNSVAFVNCTADWKNLRLLRERKITEVAFLLCVIDGAVIDEVIQFKELKRLDCGSETRLDPMSLHKLTKCDKLERVDIDAEYGGEVTKLQKLMPKVQFRRWTTEPIWPQPR
jgi:hypothetical protein